MRKIRLTQANLRSALDDWPWFVLKSIPGIGNHLIKRLIDRFKTPESIYQASRQALLEVSGISDRLAATLQRPRTPDAVRQEFARLAAASAYQIVTLIDPCLSASAAQIPDPPPYLYVHGCLDVLAGLIAVVGSRHATDYGLSRPRDSPADLATSGITIVSGMARGIDTAAHQGALMAGGPNDRRPRQRAGANLSGRKSQPLFQIARRGRFFPNFP